MTKILHEALVLWLALTLVFVALRVLPGDAVSGTAVEVSQASMEARREAIGLNDPLVVQYQHYLTDLAHGDLGHSLISSESVWSMITVRLGPTLSLGFATFAVALLLGTLLGFSSGLPDLPQWSRKLSSSLIVLSQAVPFYVTALAALYLFSLELNWFPASGSRTPLHLVLPATTLGFHVSGSIARVLSVNLREAYQQPFMLTARAKGLPPIDLLDHALRIALLPTISVLAIQAGFLLGGTVIVEVMFVRRGLGSLLYQSVLNRDYPVVQALALMGTTFYMLANGLGNLARHWLDPRLINTIEA